MPADQLTDSADLGACSPTRYPCPRHRCCYIPSSHNQFHPISRISAGWQAGVDLLKNGLPIPHGAAHRCSADRKLHPPTSSKPLRARFLKNIRRQVRFTFQSARTRGRYWNQTIYRRDWSETLGFNIWNRQVFGMACWPNPGAQTEDASTLNTLRRSPSLIPMKPPTALSLAGRGTRAGSGLAALSYILSIADAELFFANPANRLYRIMQYNARTASFSPIFLPSS